MTTSPTSARKSCALSCAALLAAWAGTATAQSDPPSEVFELGTHRIVVHVHEFLDAEELALLRTVGTEPEVLAVFMGDDAGHGAIAVAPAEGFIRGGAPAPGASALAQLPDPDTARQAALAMCESERGAGPSCVIVLEIAPLP